MTDVSWFAAQAYCKARGPEAADDRAMGICARRRRARPGRGSGALARLVRRAERRAAASPIGGARQRLRRPRHGRPRLGMDATISTPMRRPPNRATPTARTAPPFCGGAAAGVADPTDYPAFMRYAMRASLKAELHRRQSRLPLRRRRAMSFARSSCSSLRPGARRRAGLRRAALGAGRAVRRLALQSRIEMDDPGRRDASRSTLSPAGRSSSPWATRPARTSARRSSPT